MKNIRTVLGFPGDNLPLKIYLIVILEYEY